MAGSPSFTYQNNFENNFTTMSDNQPDLQRFTATGRPMPGKEVLQKNGGMTALNVVDSMGAAMPNTLPFRYTDDSILTIPVQPPPPYPASMLSRGSDDDNPIKEAKSKKRFSLSAMRRSSKAKKQPEFVMKEMTRGEYLKHYAKDENGKYIGTEDPADDILFNDPSDYLKYRAPGYRLDEHQQSEDAPPAITQAEAAPEENKPAKSRQEAKMKERKRRAYGEAMATGNAPMFI